MFRADVHCHTTFSDGQLEPAALIQKALAEGLQGLSFTDHDDIGAFRAGRDLAKELGFALAAGVELSCFEDGESVHILGYGFEDQAMESVLVDYKRFREKRNEMMLDKLSELGMPVPIEALACRGSLGRPQIALYMVEMGYVSSFREAFDKWIGDDKPAFVQVERPSVQEGIDQLHSCSGLAVLAHPHLIRRSRLLNRLLSFDFDGIEGRYGDFETDRFEKIGRKLGWLVTGGSDFHGVSKKDNRLGSSWVDKETFQRLQEGY